MNLSLRKPLALLVAGMAFVACSPDSQESPLSPPLGLQVAAPTGSPFGATVRVCKVAIFPIAPGAENVEDPNAAGEYDFEASVDGGETQSFALQSVPSITDCRFTSNNEVFNVEAGTETFEVTELLETFTDPEGYALLHSLSVTSGTGTPCSIASGDRFIADDPRDGGVAGSITVRFSAENCAGNDILIRFKNTFVPDEHEGGMEGCTPGAWRNQDGSQRPNGTFRRDRWVNTPFTATGPDATTFEEVFGAGSIGNPDLTLREALDFNANNGGEALLKHAAAAALNASVDDELLDYPYSLETVVQMFNDAWDDLEGDNNETKDLFDAANNLGCTI